MGLLLVVRRSLGGGEGGGRDVGKTGLEWGVLWIVLRAWPQGNVDRIAIEGATWATVHELVEIGGWSVSHHSHTNSLPLSLPPDLPLSLSPSLSLPLSHSLLSQTVWTDIEVTDSYSSPPTLCLVCWTNPLLGRAEAGLCLCLLLFQ